jgi:surface-anchored protein
VNVFSTDTLSLGANNFYYMTASGQFTNSADTVDLGIRIRLREDQVALGDLNGSTAFDQFENFTFTVDMGLSTFNGTSLLNTSAHIALMARDSFGDPSALFNTADNELTGTLNNIWTHQHRNWGFSEYGEYSVVLNLTGVGGAYGDTASIGSTTLNFNVIPEPSTLALVLMGLGFGGFLRKQKMKTAI